MLLGASHAGAAIERSMLGAAHSMANPLTASRGVVHGLQLVYLLPIVMAYNSEEQKCSIGLCKPWPESSN